MVKIVLEIVTENSRLARYLHKYKLVDEDKYKIHFNEREVNKKSGISNLVMTYKMVLNVEKTS